MNDQSLEQVKADAAESVQQDAGLRNRVRDLTLATLKNRKLDGQEMRRVAQAVTEGVSLGLDRRAGEIKSALHEAMSGMDEALAKAAEASQLAIACMLMVRSRSESRITVASSVFTLLFLTMLSSRLLMASICFRPTRVKATISTSTTAKPVPTLNFIFLGKVRPGCMRFGSGWVISTILRQMPRLNNPIACGKGMVEA